MQAIDKPAITAGEPPEPNAAARPADAFAPDPLAAEPRATGPVGVDNEAAVQAAARAARDVPVVVACVGTSADQQGLTRQAEALAAAGLDARVRPEQLTLADFAALDAALRAVR